MSSREVRNLEALSRLCAFWPPAAASFASELAIDAKTAAGYLHILEQLFFVLRLPA